MEDCATFRQKRRGMEGDDLMFEGIPLNVLTPSALLGLCILFIFLGKLVPVSYYREKCKEADRWRSAYETSEKARATSDAQAAQLLEFAKTTNTIVVATLGTAERLRQSGGADVASSAKL